MTRLSLKSREQQLTHPPPNLASDRFPLVVKPHVNPAAKCCGLLAVGQFEVELEDTLQSSGAMRVARVDRNGPTTGASQGLARQILATRRHFAHETGRQCFA